MVGLPLNKNVIHLCYQSCTTIYRKEVSHMDQIKIGKFIAEMRKEKNLTQKQLAELIGISDKAVSKWECGKSMPDNSILLKLCEILNINVNELLSGEKLSIDDYHGKAEENMVNLIKDSKNPTTKTITVAISIILLLSWIWLLVISMNGSIYWFLDIYSFIPILAFTLIIMIMSGSLKDFFRAFPICFSKSSKNKCEIRRAYSAIKLGICSIIVSGLISSLLAVVTVLGLLENRELLGPNLAVAILSILYSLIMVLVLLPFCKILSLKLYEE